MLEKLRVELSLTLLFLTLVYCVSAQEDNKQSDKQSIDAMEWLWTGYLPDDVRVEKIKNSKPYKFIKDNPEQARQNFKDAAEKHKKNEKNVLDPEGTWEFFNAVVGLIPDALHADEIGTGTSVFDEYVNGDVNERARIARVRNNENSLAEYKTAVIDWCGNNKNCISEEFKKARNDDEFQALLRDGNMVEKFNAMSEKTIENAQNNAPVKNKDKAKLELESAKEKFHRYNISKEAKTKLCKELGTVEMENLYHTARLLKNLQQNDSTILDNLKELKQTTDAVLFGLGNLQTRIDSLADDIRAMREDQLEGKINELFLNSDIAKQIDSLKNPNSAISKLYDKRDSTLRNSTLEDLESIQTRQNIVLVCDIINTWGPVGKQALTVFWKGAPKSISQSIDIGMTTSNIINNLIAGTPTSYASAAMGVLGLFGKHEPGPEMQMLQQISEHLAQLEKNMNQQFTDVHFHLFQMEQNIAQAFNNMNQKIDSLSLDIYKIRVSLMQGFNRMDSKLDYITLQNDCIKNLILETFAATNIYTCRAPVEQFKGMLLAGKISNFEALNNFFEVSRCKSCIEALSDIQNAANMLTSPVFRYSQCETESTDQKANPQRLYDYLYRLFFSHAPDVVRLNSLLFLPSDIRGWDSIRLSLRQNMTKPIVNVGGQDRVYRNYKSVLNFSDYLLTMFTFLELENNGKLLSRQEIKKDFADLRSNDMIDLLKNTIDLINHTIIQQSLLSGNGLFEVLDDQLAKGALSTSSNDYNIIDALNYDPDLRKNYASYLLHKDFGYEQLVALTSVSFKLPDFQLVIKKLLNSLVV